MDEWTKEFELGYWNKQTAKADAVKMQGALQGFPAKFFKHLEPTVVADVGGGRYGGALQVYTKGQSRLVIDKLGSEFDELGDLPVGVNAIACDFSEIPLPDNHVDVLFAWEVFDHANTMEQFVAGMRECQRILAPGGAFLLFHLVRPKPQTGHILALQHSDIYDNVTLRKLWRKDDFNPAGIGRCRLILTKD